MKCNAENAFGNGMHKCTLLFCFFLPQIPIAEVPSRVGEGSFIRDDGEEIPDRIIYETSKAFDVIRDRCGTS